MTSRGFFSVLLVALTCSFGQYGIHNAEALIPQGESVQKSPIVRTETGLVQGIMEETIWLKKPYASYLGIRFGEKPVRFEAAEPAEPWSGIYDASMERAVCSQVSSNNQSYIGDEDCLFINVYTPDPDSSALRPVMLYIYGGAYTDGYKSSSYFGPELFMEENIIVAIPNYRLGALGFLATEYETSTGNYGLKDQLLAMKWVRNNIKNFGGDPDKITIVGQSAGGASVDLHLLSPKSRGLFRSSISMSASALCLWAFQQPRLAKSRAYELASRLNRTCNNDKELIQFLRTVPARVITEETYRMSKIYILPFTPTVEVNTHDGTMITECPYKTMKDCNFARLPHFNGYAGNEMILYASLASTILDRLRNSSSPPVTTPIELPIIDTVTKSLWNRTRHILVDSAAETTTQFLKVLSDFFFVAGIEEKQNLMCKCMMPANAPYYYYKMTKDSPYAKHRVQYNVNLNGTAHEDDVGYIFFKKDLNVPLDPNSRLSIFRRRAVRLWANFVKYLDPTPVGEKDRLLKVDWPNSCNNGQQMLMNDEFTVHERLASQRALVFQSLSRNLMPIYTGCNASETVSTILDTVDLF